MANKKPAWVIEREQGRRATANATYWMFGLHAVEAALRNPDRKIQRLVLTKNAAQKLESAVTERDQMPEIADPRKFPVPFDAGTVHQGAAAEVEPLQWPSLPDLVAGSSRPVIIALDRVSDPHNVGAVLRSARVFNATAVLAPARHSAPETGALAKSASGALESQPYVRVKNLGNTLEELKKSGITVLGLDGDAKYDLETEINQVGGGVTMVLGAEGPGLRSRSREICDRLVRVSGASGFGSLNVSNAAAIALYVATQRN